jgi:hypothetical protein
MNTFKNSVLEIVVFLIAPSSRIKYRKNSGSSLSTPLYTNIERSVDFSTSVESVGSTTYNLSSTFETVV